MKLKKFIFVCLAMSFMYTCCYAKDDDSFDFSALEKKVFEATLDNGLKLIIFPNHDAPVISMATCANVGGSDDPKGYSGLAHMFEHMAFKGTTKIGVKDYEKEVVCIAKEDVLDRAIREERSKGLLADQKKLEQLEKDLQKAIEESYALVIPNEFTNILQREGAVGLNAFTSADQTCYIMSMPSNKLELWIAMESERFLHPVLREMYKERMVIQEERRMRTENTPSGRLHEEFLATAFRAHPYGTPIVGHMSDIINYNRDEAKKFFEKYYSPSNLTIALVGDIDPQEGLKLVKKYWDRIPRREKPPRISTVEPEQKAERRVVIEEKTQPSMMIGWHIPEEIHPDMWAISALGGILGQGRTSRLYKRMVLKDQVAVSAGAFGGYPGGKYPSLFVVYSYPAHGKTNAECEKIIDEEIEKLQNTLVSKEELDIIKARSSVGCIRDLRDNLEFAIRLTRYQQLYNDWRELFKEVERINAVTPEDIQRVAKKYFKKTNRTIATIETIKETETKEPSK